MSTTCERHPPPDDAGVIGTRVIGVITAWLTTGVVALGSEAFQTNIVVEILVCFCTAAQLWYIPNLFGRMHEHWPGRGNNYFLAGLAGLIITTVSAIAYHASYNAATLLWSFSGNYMGWLFELCTGRFESWMPPLSRRAGQELRDGPDRPCTCTCTCTLPGRDGPDL